MGRRITWSDRAKAELRSIDQRTAMRMLYALANYAEDESGDVIKLQGFDTAEYRLRIGDYRARFRLEPGAIFVTAVGHRRDIYR